MTVAIAGIQIELRTLKVFDLEVENLRTFFVGEEGVVVHNARTTASQKKQQKKIKTSMEAIASGAG